MAMNLRRLLSIKPLPSLEDGEVHREGVIVAMGADDWQRCSCWQPRRDDLLVEYDREDVAHEIEPATPATTPATPRDAAALNLDTARIQMVAEPCVPNYERLVEALERCYALDQQVSAEQEQGADR